MKLVLISDTHGLHDDVDVPNDGDVLIHGGDITRHGRLEEVEDFADWMGIRRQRHKIVIAGNHDRCLQEDNEAARQHLTTATYLQDSGTTIDGLEFWGSPWTPQFFDWSFMLPRGEPLARKWAMIPESVDVLVTHGPPKGILDTAHLGKETGCAALRERVFEIQPRLHVFGHIHEARGRVERAGIQFVNASCYGGKEPFVVEL